MRFDHVQFGMPEGGETEADRFYRDVLGFTVVPKPAALASRGGRWYEKEGVALHLGVDPEFQPSAKAHVCFIVDNFDELVATASDAGFVPQFDSALEGVTRCYLRDPFGNRIELQQLPERDLP